MNSHKKYTLKGDIEKLREILIDLIYFGKLHPLIKKVEKLNSSNKGSYYKISERPYSWLPVRVNYNALVSHSSEVISYEISNLPMTSATINYQLGSLDSNLIDVDFHLEIKSRAPGKKILQNKMLNAQDRLMDAIQVELSKTR